MKTIKQRAPNISVAEFEAMFESVKNWGRWGKRDQRGTLNYITPEHVRQAASLVRSGRTVSMAIPINTVAGPDNPHPAIHYMSQNHDIPVGDSRVGFAMDFLGMECHGDCHTHIDALNHISYGGLLYNGRPVSEGTSKGMQGYDITTYANGVVGRGVLLDIPRLRGIRYLEPGEAVTRAELEAAEKAQGIRIGAGDILVFRTGHHRRRLEKGAWDNGYDRIPYPIHPLQVTAMGMVVSDSLNLEDVARACEEEQRWEFMVVAEPLRLPDSTGSPFNPIALL